MKIAVMVMSRANYGRLLSVIQAIDTHPAFELQLITGASALHLPMPYKPSAVIQCLVDGDNTQGMVLTTGLLSTQIGGILEQLKPDVVLVHGDRYELLACAMAAAYMNIPLAHTEGGEDTGTIDDKVRYAISALADIHFPVTDRAAARLTAMGCNNVHVVGSTALDTVAAADLTNDRTQPYMLVLHHPNTTQPEDIQPVIDAVSRYDIHKVWVNPNVDAGSKAMLKLIHRQQVEFVKDLPVQDYARILANCEVAVGNSSSFIKEGAFLGKPAVIIGNRQQDREHGNNVLYADNDTDMIANAIRHQMETGKFKPDYRFGDGTAAKKIVQVLEGLCC